MAAVGVRDAGDRGNAQKRRCTGGKPNLAFCSFNGLPHHLTNTPAAIVLPLGYVAELNLGNISA